MILIMKLLQGIFLTTEWPWQREQWTWFFDTGLINCTCLFTATDQQITDCRFIQRSWSQPRECRTPAYSPADTSCCRRGSKGNLMSWSWLLVPLSTFATTVFHSYPVSSWWHNTAFLSCLEMENIPAMFSLGQKSWPATRELYHWPLAPRYSGAQVPGVLLLSLDRWLFLTCERRSTWGSRCQWSLV